MSVTRAQTARVAVAWRPALRLVEMFVLFGLFPWWWSGWPVREHGIFPPLLAGCALCLPVLLLDPSFDKRRLWNARSLLARLPFMLGLFALAAGVLGLGTWLFEREHFLGFVSRAPAQWAIVMLFYPLLSVYPQEIIFRAFFFHRYGGALESIGRWIGGGDRSATTAVILASALAFGWAHVIFETGLAVALSAVGGLLFAWTYARTRSTLASSIEHALYGDFLFTIGLGVYFYTGAIGQL